MTEEDPRPKSRTPRLSVAGLMETVRIREGAEALDKHRKKVVYAMGAALLSRLALEMQHTRIMVSRGEDVSGAVAVISLVIVAYVAALWFMALRGHDRFGFGIALGVAVIEATSQLLGMIRGELPAMANAWPIALVIVSHVALAAAAFQASRDFPSESSSSPWIKGFLVAVLFIVGVPTLRSNVMRSAGGQVRVLTRPQAPAPALAASLAQVNRCARSYAAANPSAGFPRALSAMGPRGSGCLTDTLVAQGEGVGWMFTYVPGERDSGGRIGTYTVMARQSALPGQGVGFFVSDQTGIVRPSRPIGR